MILLLAFLLAPPATAQARPITFAFTGEVDFLVDWGGLIYPEYVTSDSLLSGRFTFESTTPNATPDSPWEANYEGAITRFEGQVGALFFDDVSPPDNVIVVDNDHPVSWQKWDRYVLGATVQLYGVPTTLDMGFEDHSASALDSNALPQIPPPLDGFDLQGIQFDIGGMAWIDGHLNTFTLVPEPGGLLMIGLGAAALVARRGRRDR